jgi:hypothetical protein
MEAYGLTGIPHAFIVREKKVLWHGYPVGALDRTLEDVIAGNFDLAKTKAAFKTEALTQKFREAVAAGDDATAQQAAAEIQGAIKDGALAITTFDANAEKRMVRSMILKDEFRNAVFQDQNKEAEELGKRLLEIDPKADLKALRTEALVRKDAMAYLGAVTGKAGGEVDHKKLGAELAGKLKGQPELADKVAWTILTDESIKHREVPLALEIAKQALADSESKSASILDTYSRALFDSGKKEEAVKFQEKAVAVADEEERPNYERTLKAYKEGKLPTTE